MGGVISTTIVNEYNKTIWVKCDIDKKNVKMESFSVKGQVGVGAISASAGFSVMKQYDWNKIEMEFTPIKPSDHKKLTLDCKDSSVVYFTIVAEDDEVICNRWSTNKKKNIVITEKGEFRVHNDNPLKAKKVKNSVSDSTTNPVSDPTERKSLENKARLYEKITSGAVFPDEAGSDLYLVDFQKKVIDGVLEQRARVRQDEDERQRREEEERERREIEEWKKQLQASVPEAEDEEEQWVDFVDSFGRSRRCLKKDLPDLQRQDNELKDKKERKQTMSVDNVDGQGVLNDTSEIHYDRPCESCTEGGRNVEAVCFCLVCFMFLCQECLTVHSRLRSCRRHPLLRGDGMPKRVEDKPVEFPQCADHVSRVKNLYCYQHETIICYQCRVDMHESCRVRSVRSVEAFCPIL